MNLNNLHDLYVAQLKDAYSAEKQLTEALPKMVSSASSKKLQTAFEIHLEQTKSHMETVRSILDEIDENPTSTKCKAMEGLIEEASEIANKNGDSDARDAALIVAAQKIEHYEIATYGGLSTFARSLSNDNNAVTLQNILNEEYYADQALDDLAMGLHNLPNLNKEAKS